MAQSLQIGDVVYLNSGSPELTVAHVATDVIKVAWIASGVVNEHIFHADTLRTALSSQ